MSEMPHPPSPTLDALAALLDRFEKLHGFARLDEAGFGDFAAAPGDCVVLFAEDPARVPETWDVAVVLPEVLKDLGGRLRAGVLDMASARRLAPRYGFGTWPALVFLRDGGYVGVIEGMRDWAVYRREASAMLGKPVGRAPTLGVAVRAEGAAGTCH